MTETPHSAEHDELTRLLIAWSEGDQEALDKIFPLAFQDLRQIARKCHRKIPDGSVQPTELIGEIYTVLLKQKHVHWECRGQFYKFAAFLMERILLGCRRTRGAHKRGGDVLRVPLIEALDVAANGSDLATHPEARRSRDNGHVSEHLSTAADITEAIEGLANLDPSQADVVRFRYLIGLSIEETAETLGISKRTVTRKWKHAKRFLAQALEEYGPD